LTGQLEDCPVDDLLYSPLTSLESTPESSPVRKCVELPDVDPALPSVASSSKVVNEPSESNKSEREKKRNMQQSRKNRKKRERMEKLSGFEAPKARDKAREKYTTNTNPIFTPMATSNAPVANGGYIALNRPMGEGKKKKRAKKGKKDDVGEEQNKGKKEFTLEELINDYDFQYKAWEGE
jgi:hypothetical protein